MVKQIYSITSVAAVYLLKMLQPRLTLMAMLLIYYQVNFARGTLQTEVTRNGELQLKTQHVLYDKISLDPSMNSQSEEAPAVGPFVGNAEFVHSDSNSIKKRDCEMPSIASRGLLGSSLKRSYFATSQDEVARKIQEEDMMEHRMSKRSAEVTEGFLPWTCETKYEWKDMGSDHYPRFVRTAECKSKFCVRGFYRCKPRRYKTKILRRITGTESSSCEEDDVSLPETLRSSWRFITVTISLCCDCTGPGRVPGADV